MVSAFEGWLQRLRFGDVSADASVAMSGDVISAEPMASLREAIEYAVTAGRGQLTGHPFTSGPSPAGGWR